MKKSIIINIISWLGISLLLFFYLERQLAFHYFYIEQFRMFRFKQDYALQLFSHPGGISEYIASFLIQYFIHPHIGPLIMTSLFLCIGIGVQNIWRKLSPNLEMPLAYLMPGILLLLADMDFNHHLEGILAYASVVWILNLYIRIRSPFIRIPFMAIASWLLFYFAGPAFEAVILCAIFYEFYTKSSFKWYSLLLLPLGIFPACWWYQTGLGGEARIVFSPDAYFNPRLALQPIIYYAWGALLLIFILACLCGKFKGFKKKWMTYTSPILQIILAGWFLHNETKAYNSPTLYLVKELDYYARTEQWDKLLSAPLRSDKNAMHACFQNLALAQKGILADKALSLKQVGADGLWIAWNRSTTASTLLSDVYYAMGNVALAQRMAFEGMISSEWTVNPRLLTRLVKTNLIYGNHAVAGKYISMLEDTHAYKEQAVALKRFLNNDEAIDKDPELGFKRRCIAKTDGLAQIEGVPYDLLQIIASNPECKTAFEYLGIFCLMNKDIIPFNQLIETYHNAKGLSPMPVSFQEAIILAHEGDTAAWTRLGVTPQVAERFRTFKQTVLQNRGSAALPNKLHTGFGNTYWYYYMFKK